MFEVEIDDAYIGRVACIISNSPFERWVVRPLYWPDHSTGEGRPFASRKAAIEWLIAMRKTRVEE